MQLVRDRVRLQNQLEALLEETRVKLSSIVSELLGLSGRRILRALADGENDPVALAQLGDFRLKCSKEELADALRGHWQPLHRQMLQLFLERLGLLDRQIHQLDRMAAETMQPYEDAVVRLAQVGVQAQAFASAVQFASWAGLCPGREESAERNQSSRCPKGNPFLRRVLTQAAQAAVKKKGSHFQIVFRQWLRRLGYQAALWAIAHKLGRLVWKILHDGVHYQERGEPSNPVVQRRRARRMIQALRTMGYQVEISSLNPQLAQG